MTKNLEIQHKIWQIDEAEQILTLDCIDEWCKLEIEMHLMELRQQLCDLVNEVQWERL